MSKKKNVVPIFLFSLPRSGSTLIQRVLGAREEIATESEPWFLLPLLYSFKKEGCFAEYGHDVSVRAVTDFISTLENGKEDYLNAVNTFSTSLYSSANKKTASYFLDKTPRYHLVAEQIIEAFPEGKFIFLWRNPLAIISSILNSWGRPGQWNLHISKVDLFDGVQNLVSAYNNNRGKVFAARYEDLVSGDEKIWEQLFEYLDLPMNRECLNDFISVKMSGSTGDPTGVKKYNSISTKSVTEWKQHLRNPIRKGWCQRYLRNIGEELLRDMGYSCQEISRELRDVPVGYKHVFSDIVGLIYNVLYSYMEIEIFKAKYLKQRRMYTTHGHH
jgi:hypothetical protein